MNGDIPLNLNPAPPPPPPEPEAPPPEDASSRALEDALRSSFFIIKIIMAGLAVVFLCSGFFTVKPQQKAIVLRFGKPVGEGASAVLGPGFHWAWPAPIDEKVFIPASSVQIADSTVGWYLSPQDFARGVEPPPPGQMLSPANTSYVLTADTNILHARATVQYTITDPIRFNFDFLNAPVFITNAINNALLATAAEFKVDDILTQQKSAYHEALSRRLIQLIDEEKLGVQIIQVSGLEEPPRYLKPKFDEVVAAGQQSQAAMQNAQAYAETNVASATSQANIRVALADADRRMLVATMSAQAARFSTNLPIYLQNPDLFRQFMVMQAWTRVLSNAPTKIVQPLGDRNIIQISRPPLAPPPLAP